MAYCDWWKESEMMKEYHEAEWGIPVHDDRRQFEFIVMEVMQCGLNFRMILKKREIFRSCFDDFDCDAVAAFGEKDIAHILTVPGMIHSRRKIEAVINNAMCFQQIRKEYGSFSVYLWQYTNGKTILYHNHEKGYVPASNALSDKISKDMKERGFQYLGSITVYSHLQAAGLINDHGEDCPCYKKINAENPTIYKRRELEQGIHFYNSK
jgi:3-methyladenine DNA glycosylase